MRREGILNNFEKMELVLISDFHYFNLLFCKDELMLSDRKACILMNILWQLLMHNNPGYRSATKTAEHELGASPSVNHGDDLDGSAILQKKRLEDDVNLLKTLLLNHSCGPTEEELLSLGPSSKEVPQMKVFELSQVRQIVEYAFNVYVEKFNLYKYVFENKKKNEEVVSM
jgi:Flagellar C1a complex subunit C1a-32